MNSSTPWIKANASNQSGNCVQLRRHDGLPEVRDSKHPEGPVLRLSRSGAALWLNAARSGELDHLADPHNA